MQNLYTHLILVIVSIFLFVSGFILLKPYSFNLWVEYNKFRLRSPEALTEKNKREDKESVIALITLGPIPRGLPRYLSAPKV